MGSNELFSWRLLTTPTSHGCLNQLHHSSESHHKEQFMWETGFSTGSAQTQAPLCTYVTTTTNSHSAYLSNATHMPFNGLTTNYYIFIIAVKHNLPFSSILWRTWLLRFWNKICCLDISCYSFQNSTWQPEDVFRVGVMLSVRQHFDTRKLRRWSFQIIKCHYMAQLAKLTHERRTRRFRNNPC